MDAVAGLLDGPRARGAFLLRSTMDPPWSLRIEDEAPLTLMAIVRGSACVVPDDGEIIRLDAGDVAIVRGPDPYLVADAPDTLPQATSTRASAADARRHRAEARGLPRHPRLGQQPDGETVMLTGTYQLDGEVSRRLLRALPPLLVLEGDAWETPLIALLAEEIVKDQPGQEAVLDRLLDLLLIAVLRTWFARPEAQAPRWYRAYADPVVGPALRALHDDPAQRGPSRSWPTAPAFPRRARAPVQRSGRRAADGFLTGWRIASPPTSCASPTRPSARSPTRSATAAPSP